MPSQEYKDLLDDAWKLHVAKNAGYAGADNPDPWANFRMCEAFGISAFDGCMVRLSDKYIRVTNLMKSADNDQVGESLRDTLQDLSAYANIAICLLDEQHQERLVHKPEPTAMPVGVPLRLPFDDGEVRIWSKDGPEIAAMREMPTTGVEAKKWADSYEAAVEPWACPSYCCGAKGAIPHDGECLWCPKHNVSAHA